MDNVIKRLEKENAELKAENARLKEEKCGMQILIDNYIALTEKYHRALQEIKAIAKDNIIGCFSDKCDLADEILQKITKTESEEV